MDKTIVYVDDAEYALRLLTDMADRESGMSVSQHWIVVACPPRMTRHISKWVNHSARLHWRNKWAEKLFAQITPRLMERGWRATTVLASGPLLEMTRELLHTHGTARVLDARRPKFGQDMAPVSPRQANPQDTRRVAPTVGMGTLLASTGE